MSKQKKDSPKSLFNKLYYGDNLEVLRKYIKDETIDLCYIDPPFNSKRNYNQIYNRIGKEDRAQAQAFIDTWTWDEMAEKGYAEIIENYNGSFTAQIISLIAGLKNVLGKDSLLAYLIHITLRATEIQRILKPAGSFYLHCDPTASHYLKIILDAIFVPKGGDFRNEIIWCYTGPGSPGMRQFMRKHDVVFWYNKGETWTFNRDEVRTEHSKKTKENYKEGLIGSGFIEADHKIHDKGKVPEDWWEFAIAPRGKEYLGYPTQKPEKLLERIIKASSNDGDIILDAYCGCGTSVAVAERLHRKWVGIDITYQSISLILKRLEDNIGKTSIENIELNGVPQDIKSAIALANKKDDRVRKEFEKWCVLTYSNNRAIINEQKGGDKGIDGLGFIQELDKAGDAQPRKIIFSVKSDKTLIPSYVRDLKGVIEREDAVMGVFICLYEPTKGMREEAQKAGTYKNSLFQMDFPKLTIVTVQEILNDVRLNIPIIEVVKRAEHKGKENTNQGKLDL
jgi:DNA modification methylase